jgi:hypothetical protein
MKSIKLVQAHDNKKEEGKPFYKEVGNLVLSDDAYDWMMAHNEKVMFFPNAIPNACYFTTFREFEGRREGGAKEPF